jgi:hypothetical protein
MPFQSVFAEGQAEQLFDTNNVTFAITQDSFSPNTIKVHVSIEEKPPARHNQTSWNNMYY